MARAGADILQVVVLSADAQTLLRRRRPVVIALLQPQKRIFELHHTCVYEQKRRIVCRHKAAAVHDLMTPRLEIVQKIVADLERR